jgi:hypothetical protein
MKPPFPNSKPTLEELLRVKRAERPPAEFWKRFEDELRAKQLAAIVAPRRWWQPLTALVPGRRAAALAGVGAAVAVALSAYVRFPAVQPTVVSPEAITPALTLAHSGVPSAVAAVARANHVAEIAAAVPAPVVVAEVLAASATPVEGTAHEPLLAASLANPVRLKFSEIQVHPPQAAMELVLPAANLASLRTEAGLPEPLASIPSPRDQRVARLANVAEFAMLAVPVSAPVRERVTPRDTDLREREISRVSAKGDRLGFSF